MKIDNIICIANSKKGRIWMKKQSNKKGFSFGFMKTISKFEGFESSKKKLAYYIQAIKTLNKKKSNIMLIDDSFRFVKNPLNLPEAPENYDIVFLTGMPSDPSELNNEKDKKYFVKASVENCYAMLINSKAYDTILDIYHENYKYKENIDWNQYWNQFWLDTQKRLSNCYFLKTNMSVVIPRDINTGNCTKLDSVPLAPDPDDDEEGARILSLNKIPDEDLPYITLITPITSATPNEAFFFTLLNFYKQRYPKEKLEWIIVDDSNSSDIKSLLPPSEKKNSLHSV